MFTTSLMEYFMYMYVHYLWSIYLSLSILCIHTRQLYIIICVAFSECVCMCIHVHVQVYVCMSVIFGKRCCLLKTMCGGFDSQSEGHISIERESLCVSPWTWDYLETVFVSAYRESCWPSPAGKEHVLSSRKEFFCSLEFTLVTFHSWGLTFPVSLNVFPSPLPSPLPTACWQDGRSLAGGAVIGSWKTFFFFKIFFLDILCP